MRFTLFPVLDSITFKNLPSHLKIKICLVHAALRKANPFHFTIF